MHRWQCCNSKSELGTAHKPPVRFGLETTAWLRREKSGGIAGEIYRDQDGDNRHELLESELNGRAVRWIEDG